MSSTVQLISFLVSFIYGIVFYLLARFNKYILSNKGNILKFIVTLVFIIDIVLLYSYIMYYINNGDIHIYFVSFVLLGYILISYFYKKICKLIVKK